MKEFETLKVGIFIEKRINCFINILINNTKIDKYELLLSDLLLDHAYETVFKYKYLVIIR